MATVRTRPKPKARLAELVVTAVGAQGEGVAMLDGAPVYLPLTLPGDRVEARITGERGEILAFREKASRQQPPCAHFGQCGGCALQHMPAADYALWKRRRIVEALAKKGFSDPPITALHASPPGSRRRTTLSYEKHGARLVLGYHGKRDRDVVDIACCLVVTPQIDSLIAPLKRCLAGLAPRSGKVMLTQSDSGLDMLVTGIGDLSLAERETLAAFAQQQDLARLSVMAEIEPGHGVPETVVARRTPLLAMGGASVPLFPAGFLQATRQGETALVEAVLHWTKGQKVADLFAGGGTFSLPLAQNHTVSAFEMDAPLLASLNRAAGGRVTTQRRDLFATPLMGRELEAFDTVVIDPPRAGARAQAQALASSGVRRVIAVSCNPASFARDARILVEGGYELVEICAVDQFLWSPHVELAALLMKNA